MGRSTDAGVLHRRQHRAYKTALPRAAYCRCTTPRLNAPPVIIRSAAVVGFDRGISGSSVEYLQAHSFQRRRAAPNSARRRAVGMSECFLSGRLSIRRNKPYKKVCSQRRRRSQSLVQIDYAQLVRWWIVRTRRSWKTCHSLFSPSKSST